tara:strand:- start:1916 stop:2326 length:411 start_codon:yes stop_codon:yes gene_type:complete
MTTEYTYQWPMKDGAAAIPDSTMTDTLSVIRFNIKNTLFACPGERMGDPDFGVCIRKLALFEFPNEQTLINIHSQITKQLNKYLPYIYIQNLQVSSPKDQPEILRITLRYIIGDENIEDIIKFDIQGDGDGSGPFN